MKIGEPQRHVPKLWQIVWWEVLAVFRRIVCAFRGHVCHELELMDGTYAFTCNRCNETYL